MKPIIIFSGTSGLNTVDDPARLPKGDVAEMVNMRVDQSGRPSKRTGLTLVESGAFHSLYSDGGDCFVAKDRTTDTAIYQVAADGTITGIRSDLTLGARISFKQAGVKTYYTNGVQTGIIDGGNSGIWEVGTYHGVTTDRDFTIPVNMIHLETHAGRMYASSGPTLWWSELFRFDLFDQARSLVQFNSDIRMIKAVAGGLYVSTEKNTYFLSGSKPAEFGMIKVASFPAAEWSGSIEYVDGGDLGFDPGLCALWASTEGAILGTPGGQIINLTKPKIIYPEGVNTGFGCLMGYNFIHGVF